MTITHIRCTCSEVVLKSVEGVCKVRSKVVVIRADGVFAVCKKCSNDVPLPLKLDMTSNYTNILTKSI